MSLFILLLVINVFIPAVHIYNVYLVATCESISQAVTERTGVRKDPAEVLYYVQSVEVTLRNVGNAF